MTILQINEKRAALRAMSNDALVKSFGKFLQTRHPLDDEDERVRLMYEFEFERRCKEAE